MVAIPTTPLLDAATARGLHVTDLGRLLDVDRHTAAMWLVGLRPVPDDVIPQLAALLGVPDRAVRHVPPPFDAAALIEVHEQLDRLQSSRPQRDEVAGYLRQQATSSPARLRLLTAGEAVAVSSLLDEFATLCPGEDLGHLAHDLAERIRQRLRH
jgi:hypothetical protein